MFIYNKIQIHITYFAEKLGIKCVKFAVKNQDIMQQTVIITLNN
jgi:hypothetical protein